MMNFILTLLASAAVSASLSALVVWLTKTWITERLKNAIKHEYDEKLESHKAQLKARADVETERLKSQLSIAAAEHQVRFSGLHEKRAEVIAEVYGLLVQAYWDGASFASPAEFAGEPGKREKYNTAMKSLFAFSQQFERNRIYLPEDVCLLIDPVIQEMRGKIVSFGTYLDFDGPGVLDETYREKHRIWWETWRYFDKEVPTVRRALERDLRSLLGDVGQPIAPHDHLGSEISNGAV
jgi:hypothetical protein